jgi:hypothetical protein
MERRPQMTPRKFRVLFTLLTHASIMMIGKNCRVVRHIYRCSGKDVLLTVTAVRVVRSRRSDLSTYSFHYWGQDAYKTGESRPQSDDTSRQLSSSQSRSSTGMQLGAHAAFHHCHFHLLSMQSSDNSKISDATSNLSIGSVGRGSPLY